ncbi:MAG: response regulator, partial [Anaerolineaceae bacterium]|nr:response regulator [Anaerolineaceae bacterium]
MPGLIKVLLVEDNEEDAELLLRHLRTKGMPAECLRVASAAAMRSALNEGTWDVILADYTMPGFSGLEAIKIAQADPKKVPVILVSGSIGETLAVEAMKAGAHDYLMKDSLARLIPAIQHAIENRHNQEEIEKAEL